MNKTLVTSFLESSFLSPLLSQENVTDISYNGENIFYLDNSGRHKSDIQVDEKEASAFIRQIANISNSQFSYTNPILDINLGKYRINAVHNSINKKEDKETVSFAIRMRSEENKVAKDHNFLPSQLKSLLDVLIKSHISIVIGGLTGSGKTELQRFLFSLMEENSKTIIIDSLAELENVYHPSIDISYWEFDERRETSSLSSLIKNALRNNPDWLVISEARGEEMEEILFSAMTGLPIITTIHSLSIENMKERIVALILNHNQNYQQDTLEKEITAHLPIFIYVKKEMKNGKIIRYVESVIENDINTFHYIYQKTAKQEKYYPLSASIISKINLDLVNETFIKNFGAKK